MNAKYDARLSPMTRLIYADLLVRCNYGARATSVSDSELSKLFGVTERSVRRSISALCDCGYVSKSVLLDRRKLKITKERLNVR